MNSLIVKLNGNRVIEGLLRGFDPFMNLVVDNTEELIGDKGHQTRIPIGTVVRHSVHFHSHS